MKGDKREQQSSGVRCEVEEKRRREKRGEQSAYERLLKGGETPGSDVWRGCCYKIIHVVTELR